MIFKSRIFYSRYANDNYENGFRIDWSILFAPRTKETTHNGIRHLMGRFCKLEYEMFITTMFLLIHYFMFISSLWILNWLLYFLPTYLIGATTALRSWPASLGLPRLLCPYRRPNKTLRAGSFVSMHTKWPVHRSLASLIRCMTVRSPYISYSSSL